MECKLCAHRCREAIVLADHCWSACNESNEALASNNAPWTEVLSPGRGIVAIVRYRVQQLATWMNSKLALIKDIMSATRRGDKLNCSDNSPATTRPEGHCNSLPNSTSADTANGSEWVYGRIVNCHPIDRQLISHWRETSTVSFTFLNTALPQQMPEDECTNWIDSKPGNPIKRQRLQMICPLLISRPIARRLNQCDGQFACKVLNM